MHEALCRSFGTTLDIVDDEGGPPIKHRTSDLGEPKGTRHRADRGRRRLGQGQHKGHGWTLSPSILQQLAIQRWNGVLSTYLGAGAPMPFLNTGQH